MPVVDTFITDISELPNWVTEKMDSLEIVWRNRFIEAYVSPKPAGSPNHEYRLRLKSTAVTHCLIAHVTDISITFY